jgi:adenosine kinase
MSHEIAVTGSVAFDHIMNFKGRFKDHILPDKLHMLNVSFLVNELKRLHGGCAANVAYACALHGLRARLVASVGSDFGDYGRWLSERGVDLSGVQTHKDCLTASCFITTDADNNQITGFFPGAMAHARSATIGGLSGNRPALAIVSPNDPDAMRAYPKECRRLGVPFLYDPGQNVIALSGEDLKDGLTGARVLVCNDYELAMVKEKTGLDEAALLERCEALVVTLGKEGSRILPRGQDPVEVPAVPVDEVVDPTGAGDAYRGGLIRGMVEGADWETCARLGTLTATYCVEVRGTTGYAFDAASFARRYEDAFGVTTR